jgi:sigma-54 dependent transcriptional regulator, acetoin dehydrogenase operon transcriptional activator AcoR
MLQELAPNRHHTLAPDVLAAFKNYVWPGNVRQLHGVLRTAVIMAGADACLSSQHLPDDLLEELQLPLPTSSYEPAVAPSQTEFTPLEPGNNIDSMAQVKMDSIRHALQVCGGNVSLAARQLNVSRNTIYRKLRADAKEQ